MGWPKGVGRTASGKMKRTGNKTTGKRTASTARAQTNKRTTARGARGR